MESESKTSLASTWDNVEAIFKRVIHFVSETFDKNTNFETGR